MGKHNIMKRETKERNFFPFVASSQLRNPPLISNKKRNKQTQDALRKGFKQHILFAPGIMIAAFRIKFRRDLLFLLHIFYFALVLSLSIELMYCVRELIINWLPLYMFIFGWSGLSIFIQHLLFNVFDLFGSPASFVMRQWSNIFTIQSINRNERFCHAVLIASQFETCLCVYAWSSQSFVSENWIGFRNFLLNHTVRRFIIFTIPMPSIKKLITLSENKSNLARLHLANWFDHHNRFISVSCAA